MAKVSRRKFILGGVAGGAALVVGTVYFSRGAIRRNLAGLVDGLITPYDGNTETPMIWFEVKADNSVILHSPKVEMGQGTLTSLAQMAADELDVAIEQIEVTHAQTMTGNVDNFATGGSTSIASLWEPLRELAATAREMIKAEAAVMMSVSADSLRTADGVVQGSGNSMTYGEVVANVSEWTVPKEAPALKPMSDYKYIGKPVARVDLKEKVFGAPIFGIDAEMPNMLYGSIARPDKVGATLASVDASAARTMPGVVDVVIEDDFVGVVAETYHQAEKAKRALVVSWQAEREWQSADIVAMTKVGEGTPVEIQRSGNPSGVINGAADGEILRAEYSSPIGAHAQIEPNGAVATADANSATVMISTQVVKLTRTEVAKRLGLKEEQVNIVPTFLGGGFGRRLHTPHAAEIAVMSRAVGRPVKCFYNRQEEFQQDTFRPPTHHVMRAKLDANNNLEYLEHDLSSGDVAWGSPMLPAIAETILGADLGAWRGGMLTYRSVPNYRATSWRVRLPFATSWWRSLGLLANTFAIESFIDELAEQAGKSPVDFRLAHIPDDEDGTRLKNVIVAAAERAGYQDQRENGRAMGFACSVDAGTPCAHVVELSVSNNQVKVHKVTCAMDPGLAVNPDQVKAQCEGSIIMGMSAALYEKMDVIDSALQPIIYGPYRMATIKDTPEEIDVVLLDGIGVPGPVGEPPLGPIGAALANAIYRATGERRRSMPLV